VLAGLATMAVGLLTQLQALPTTANTSSAAASPTRDSKPVRDYGRLPLAFVPNRGQTDARVRFSAQAGGASFWFTPSEAVFAFAKEKRGVNLRLRFLGADPTATVAGATPGPGKVNYLLGNDPAKWRTNLPTYGEVVYRDLWPGVDLAFRGQPGKLKYEFRLAPGADPAQIRLTYRGAERLALGRAGELRIQTALGVLRDSKPVSYQLVGGRRAPIASRYVLGRKTHGFALGPYDTSRPLVIDPGLVYSAYLGGGGLDLGLGIGLDAAGNAYVTGTTFSDSFPTTPGAFDTNYNGGGDAFVTKLNAAGSALVYSTYLGEGGEDAGNGIAVDAAGNAYVIGDTSSDSFPTTLGAFDTSYNGFRDAFVTKLNAAGSALVYSTYLGGGGLDQGFGIALDAAGNAYVTGVTDSEPFPTTPGAFDTSYNGSRDAFVTKLNAPGSGLVYSTHLGGSGFDEGDGISVDAAGNAYVTGFTASDPFPTTPGALDTSYNGGGEDANFDAFVTKLNAAGSALLYSTYLGGGGFDRGFGIVLDAAANAYISGVTDSDPFPTTLGAFDTSYNGFRDAFVTKLNATGSALVYSTYLGQDAGGIGIAVDAAENAYVTGGTGSGSFPTTPGAFDTSYNGGGDAFVTKLNAAGSALLYSTYLGGGAFDEGLGIALDAAGNAYVTGYTASDSFPTTPGAVETDDNGGGDAFVTNLSFGAPAALVLSPAADTNPVGTSHMVTATAEDATMQPVAGVVVRFAVTGSVNTSGSCSTGSNGQCGFSYTGPSLPGADLITAYADSDGDAMQDAGEPAATATKAWVLPASTPGQASGGGNIEVGGNRIAFGFSARSSGSGFQGSCNVVDQPGAMVRCTDVTALVITGNAATVFGNATVNGVATTYRIDAVDNANPGRGADTFSIQTGSGYSRSGVLSGGNVQVG
jgi:Beta-propeller repeat